MINMAHECDNGRTRLQFLFLGRLGRWRGDNDLFFLVNATAFLAPFFFENKSMPLSNLRRDIRLDRLSCVYKDIEVLHQLFDKLEIF